MKQVNLIILLIFSLLVANAQEPELNFSKKRGKDKKTEQVKQTSSSNVVVPPDGDENPPLNFGNTNSTAETNGFLQKIVDNSFIVVKASYNVRDKESGSNVTGTDFFSTIYCITPVLSYGFGIDNRFLKPWKSDPKYDAYKYGDDLVSVDKLEYKLLKDETYVPYTLNRTTGETLAPGFFHIADTTFHNQGLRVEVGNGAKTGYMVWFYVDPETKDVRYNVVPANITFNENSIFNVHQPANPETVIGGAFLNLNADEPGCLRLNLMGIARLDPYGSGKWELVKMQSKPTPPGKAKSVEATKSSKHEDQSNSEIKDDSIIPDQSKTKTANKDNKKKTEKESNNSKDTKPSKKSDKRSGTSTKA